MLEGDEWRSGRIPCHRGRGLGREVMRQAEQLCAGLNYDALYLWTVDSQQLYRACGYEECDRIALRPPPPSAAAASFTETLAAGSTSRPVERDESIEAAGSTWFRRRLR